MITVTITSTMEIPACRPCTIDTPSWLRDSKRYDGPEKNVKRRALPAGGRGSSGRDGPGSAWALSDPRPRFADLGGDLTLELAEVLLEPLRQLAGPLVVEGRVSPGPAGLQELRGDLGAFDRHVEAEEGVRAEADALQPAGEGGAQHGSRLGQGEAASRAVGAPRPAGIDQPDLRAMRGDPLTQELCVDAGVEGQEGSPEA